MNITKFLSKIVVLLLVVAGLSAYALPIQNGLKITYSIKNLPILKESINVELLAYKGKDTQLIATSTIEPGKSHCTLVLKKEWHEGVMDIKIGNYSSTIVVTKSMKDLSIVDNVEDLEANKINEFNDEQKALAYFRTAYLQLNKNDEQAKTIFNASNKDITKYTNYLKQLYINRMQMNASIKKMQIEYPNTFITEATSCFMVFPELKVDEKLNYTFFHKNYFKHWKFNNEKMLYTPMITFELLNYFTTFGSTKDEITWYDGINVFFKQADSNFIPSVKDFFAEYFIVQFIQSKDKEGELYLQYIYNNFIEGCSEQLNKDRFITSLKNIPNVKEGKQAPEILMNDKNGKEHSLYKTLNNYTIVFLWKPHCPYCESLLPEFRAFAKKHQNVTIFAVSLDKSEADWLEIINENATIKNWIDVSEHNGFENQGLKNYFYKATPTVFMLDKNGIIISKSVLIEELEQLTRN